MKRRWITAVLTLLFLLSPMLSWADLFDDAVDALSNDNIEAASLDHLGQALRGGLAAGYPQYTPGPSVLHGFDISTPCGSFSFGQGLVDNLAGMLDPAAVISGIQSTATNLIGAAISQLPMVGLCYAAPTMCDIVKYLQDLVNEIIQFKGLSCSQAETMLTGLGGKLRRQVETECVGKGLRSGLTIDRAQAACLGSTASGITEHAPAGHTDGNSRLIEDTLIRADAEQEIKDFAADLLGEVEISGDADGGIDVDIQAPRKRLHDEYQIERQAMLNEINESVNIVGGGSPLPADKRKQASPAGDGHARRRAQGPVGHPADRPGGLQRLPGEDERQLRDAEALMEGERDPGPPGGRQDRQHAAERGRDGDHGGAPESSGARARPLHRRKGTDGAPCLTDHA